MNCILVDRASIFDLNLLFVTLLDVHRAKSFSLIPTSKLKGCWEHRASYRVRGLVRAAQMMSKAGLFSARIWLWHDEYDIICRRNEKRAGQTLNIEFDRRKHGDIQFRTTWSWSVAGDGVQCPPGASSSSSSSTMPSRAVSPEEIFIEEGTSGNLRAIRGFP